jgi:hypothetical protein
MNNKLTIKIKLVFYRITLIFNSLLIIIIVYMIFIIIIHKKNQSLFYIIVNIICHYFSKYLNKSIECMLVKLIYTNMKNSIIILKKYWKALVYLNKLYIIIKI